MLGDVTVHEFITQFLITQKVKGLTLFKGIFGFGTNQHFNRPNDLFSFDEIPILITFIDENEKVKTTLTALRIKFSGGFIITN